jgi:D-alanine transaminase/branched-chain amino acid aminotransferase
MIVSCSLNGQILPPGKFNIDVNDLGLLRGYAIFDFCRTANGKPFLLPLYLSRFRNSARLMDLDLAYTDDQITALVCELLKISGLTYAGIRFVLTGGYTEDSFTPEKPNFMITIEELSQVPAAVAEHGVKLMSFEYQREMAEVKTTNYTTALRLRKKQQEQEAYDILYYANGQLLELTRSNFFIVKDNTIITAASGILKGITRQTVLNLAQAQYQVEVRDVKLTELTEADEAFFTGTNKKIVPVIGVDDQLIGNGKAGRVTKSLYQAFLAYEKEYEPSSSIFSGENPVRF